MINGPEFTGQVTFQNTELERLRAQAAQAPERALKSAAQQFEALFLNTLLKSMRDASAGDGLFDSEQTKLYTSMLDQQFAQSMAKRGVGLAEMMVKQLSLQLGNPPPEAASGSPAPASPAQFDIDPMATMRHPALAASSAAAPAARSFPREHASAAPLAAEKTAAAPTRAALYQTTAQAPRVDGGYAKPAPQDFVARLLPHARVAAAETGIPERFLLGHAALESGWGRHEPRLADGRSSHNLFGIKADRSWQGATVEVATTEYINGQRERVTAKFRAYDSYADAFRDYADFLRSNQRYAKLLEQQHDAVSFAQGLQRAGYATDPRYSEKLASVINGRTLRESFIA